MLLRRTVEYMYVAFDPLSTSIARHQHFFDFGTKISKDLQLIRQMEAPLRWPISDFAVCFLQREPEREQRRRLDFVAPWKNDCFIYFQPAQRGPPLLRFVLVTGGVLSPCVSQHRTPTTKKRRICKFRPPIKYHDDHTLGLGRYLLPGTGGSARPPSNVHRAVLGRQCRRRCSAHRADGIGRRPQVHVRRRL